MKTQFLLVLLLISLLPSLSLGGPVDQYPGIIPLASIRPPANDLEFNGNLLFPQDAMRLMREGQDLSLLNPMASDLWPSSQSNATDIYNDFPKNIGEADVQFQSFVMSRSGNFRFTARVQTSAGEKIVMLYASKKAHNVLLRKSVLKKMGYVVPPIEYLPKVTIKFDNQFEKESFINRMAEDTFGAPEERWIVKNDKESKDLELQDLLVMPSDNHIYNLAMGIVPADVIKGRRILNSLLVPFSYVYVPESVNMFPFHAGRVVSESLKLEYDSSEDFSTSFEDAKWAVRKILDFTRKDIEEIVNDAKLPKEVGILLTEKLVSRRNDFARLFNMDAKILDYKANISYGDYLKDGKLLKERFDGHASRYAYGDPTNPLSGSEIFNYFLGQGQSALINNAVNLFNTYVIPQTNVQEQVVQHQFQKLEEAFQDFLKTGVYRPVPFGFYAIPTFGGGVSASRDIIAGTYLGAENLMQLADSVGISVSLGAHIGTDGIPSPWLVSAGAQATVNRRYVHLRPIRSIKAALKTPFKNILVPLLKRKAGHILDGILASNLNATTDGGEIDLGKRVTKVLEDLKELLPVGDSLMITDSIGLGVNATAGYGFTQLVSLQARIFGNQLFLSRIHILRKDENTIQIYRDLGNVTTVGAGFGLNAFIPIVKFVFKMDKGKAKTKFYSLNIKNDLERNPNLIRNLIGLRSLLLTNDLDVVNQSQDPMIVTHDFNAKTSEFGLFHWRWAKRRMGDMISVAHPSGAKKTFVRHAEGRRFGKNYQALATDLINGVINAYSPIPFGLNSEGNGNPADSIFGEAKSKESVYDAEVEKYDRKKSTGEIKKQFVALSYKWRGQNAGSKKVKKILTEIQNKFDDERLIHPDAFSQTKSLKLYAITLDMYIYPKGISALLSTKERDFLTTFRQYSKAKDIHYSHYTPGDPIWGGSYRDTYSREDQIKDQVRRLMRYQKKYNKYLGKKRIDKSAKYAEKSFYYLEDVLPYKGFSQAVGGSKNLYVNAQVRGFRIGDENGDSPYISDSLGTFGDAQFTGPLNATRAVTGMTESEFFGNWILGVF